MKKAIILFVSMFFVFFTFAKTQTSRDIHLRAKQAGQEALRSVLPVRAYLDRNTILVEFFESQENVVITIKDTSDKTVITETYDSPELVRLQLTPLSGEYLVEITYDNTCLTGEFTLE